MLKVTDRTHKVCPGCHELKSVNGFHQNAAVLDGLQTYCRECRQRTQLMVRGEKRYLSLYKRPYSAGRSMPG